MLLAIRIPLIIIWVIISTMIGIIVSLFRPFDPRNVIVTTRLLKYGRFILGIKIKLRNAHIMKENHPCVFISNHQDNLDIFAGAYALPERTVSIGKRSIIWIPFFGLYYWLSGNILINRSNKRSAFGTMDVAAKAIKENNISIWVMPEGTRSRGRGLLPFKKGPFVTALKAGVPIVPVAWSNYVKGTNLNKWHAGTILMEVLPPIQTAGKTLADVHDIKEEAFLSMKAGIARLDLEVANSKHQR